MLAVFAVRAEYRLYRHHNRNLGLAADLGKVDDHGGAHARQQHQTIGDRHAQGNVIGQGRGVRLAGVLLVVGVNQRLGVVVQPHLGAQLGRLQVAAQVAQEVFRQLEHHVHTVATVEGRNRLVRLHHLELLNVGAGHHAVKRGGNARVGQFLTRQIERRLGRVELRLALVVFGLRHHLPLNQLLHPRQLAAGQVIAGLAITELEPVVGIVQPGDQITALHLLALMDLQTLQLAAQPERQLRLFRGLQPARELANALRARLGDGKQLDRAGLVRLRGGRFGTACERGGNDNGRETCGNPACDAIHR